MAAKPQKRMRLGIPWVAAALVLGGIIAGMAVWKLKPQEARPVHRFYYDLPEDQVFSSLARPAVAVSADGTKIAYAANGQLFLKNSDELNARPIQGTNEDPLNPFFSPDGQWIGYFDLPNKQLKKVPVDGGASVKLCEINDPYGASWGADDRIVFGDLGGVMQVSSNGGNSEIIVKGEGATLYFSSPQILPDGKTVLFTTYSRSGFQVAVQSLESDERIDLFAGNSAQYVSTGHIVYALENTLFAVPFDCDALEATGERVPLVDGVYRWYSSTPTQSSAVSEFR